MDNSALPFVHGMYLFSGGSSTGDSPCMTIRPTLAPARRRWGRAGLPFSTLRQLQAAPGGRAAPAGHQRSTDDSSLQPPSPVSVGDSAVAGVSHHGQRGTPALAGATHA